VFPLFFFPGGAMAGDDVVTNKRRKSYITNCAVSALVFPSLPTYVFCFSAWLSRLIWPLRAFRSHRLLRRLLALVFLIPFLFTRLRREKPYGPCPHVHAMVNTVAVARVPLDMVRTPQLPR
jgi:hypothetical protein